MVRCFVNECGADIDLPDKYGVRPLMQASMQKNAEMVALFVEVGAVRAHCAAPGCSGAGILKCTGCKQARYCGEPCELAHRKAHKADCRRWNAIFNACTVRRLTLSSCSGGAARVFVVIQRFFVIAQRARYPTMS